MEKAMQQKWDQLVKKLEVKFGGELDLQGILFLVGIQELGKGYKKFSKDEKLDVMHVAISTLLEPYGYYEFDGHDSEGWPHWKRSDKLPPLTPVQQTQLMQEAILEYFQEFIQE
jgi:hypothetical protein